MGSIADGRPAPGPIAPSRQELFHRVETLENRLDAFDTLIRALLSPETDSETAHRLLAAAAGNAQRQVARIRNLVSALNNTTPASQGEGD